MKRIRGSVLILVHSIVLMLFMLFLSWKLQLGLQRYFDADEFAYLHWAHNVYAGNIPIIDFLMYAPPGFLYILAPIFALFTGTLPLVAGRVFSWAVYVGIVAMLGLVLQAVRSPKRIRIIPVLLPGIILSALAIPADKMLEIRPDNIATLFALGGMYCEILFFTRPTARRAAFSGLFYAMSLYILPKTVPFVCVGICALTGWYLTTSIRDKRLLLTGFITGFLVPNMLFLLWAIVVSPNNEGIMHIVYSLTRLPFEVNRIAERFGMQADLFFYPNWTYYGMSGWSMVLLVNHALWLFGIFVGTARFVTPYLPNGKDGVWQELLVAGSFMANVALFMYGYPLRHAQYLIPIAVFIALYVSDGIYALAAWSWRRPQWISIIPMGIGFLVFLGYVLSVSTTSKLAMTNEEDFALLSAVLRRIPRDAYVFDLVGATIYYRDPYYVSAVPFGEWKPYLSRRLPDLVSALEKTQTRYVYTGKLDRVASLSQEEQRYIAERFHPMPEPLGKLLVKDN